MAAPSGTRDFTLTESSGEARLREEPFAFEFFQAVRLLERLFPDRKSIGKFVNPSDEVVRVGAFASLDFPASQIQSLEFRGPQAPLMSVNFMGLTGPQGTLPLWYTAFILDRLREGDRVLLGFLDLFNHRAISLFYQAWEKYRFTVAYERGELDRFSHHLLDLIGLGTSCLQDRQSVEDDSLIFYAGLLGQRPRSAKALEQILSDYFEVPIEIEQFLGTWYKLDSDTQCCMDDGDTSSEQLGFGAVVGDEVWDQHSRGRIKIGPLTLGQYLDFLPNGTAFEPLRAITRFFSNDEIDFEAQLILRRDDVPRCEVGAEGEASPLLGWVSWAKTTHLLQNPGDTILRL